MLNILSAAMSVVVALTLVGASSVLATTPGNSLFPAPNPASAPNPTFLKGTVVYNINVNCGGGVNAHKVQTAKEGTAQNINVQCSGAGTGKVGPAGPPGPMGPQGPKGERGEKGEPGSAGNGTASVCVITTNQTCGITTTSTSTTSLSK